MKKRLFWSLSILPLLLSSCGPSQNLNQLKEAWNASNDPIRVSPDLESTFVVLPTRGEVPYQKRPWSDSYWPTQRGGIAARWLSGTSGFSYRPPTEAQVKKMSMTELSRLSPAEKYDIYMGQFEYPTVKAERRRTTPAAAGWEGLCHGWVVSSILHVEPVPVAMTGPSGITVPFGSADVKALLTYYYGTIKAHEENKHFLGARCEAVLRENPLASGSTECRDVNAGAFHIVLTNLLGRQSRAFVMDRTRDMEVWNQPIVAYQAEILENRPPSWGSARGTVREVTIRNKVTYTNEITPRWEPVLGTQAQSEKELVYNYRLELDAKGKIIGGSWLQYERPDFLWVPVVVPFEGYWSGLMQIYKSLY